MHILAERIAMSAAGREALREQYERHAELSFKKAPTPKAKAEEYLPPRTV